MNIAMIGHKRIPSREGGVEIAVEELASRMAGFGHDVTVYNRKGEHVSGIGNEQVAYGKNFDYRGVHVKTVFTVDKKSLNAILYAFLATIRAGFSKAGVVHFHAEGSCSMIPLAKLFRKKCIATIHGLDWQRAKWGGFAKKFLLFGEKMAAKYADEVIVLSAGVQKYFRDTYGRKTVVIPNGIPAPEHRKVELISSKYGLNGQDYLLFLARLVPEKGVHTLLNAYRISGLTVPLVIAGGSSHSDDYCKKIEEMACEINEDHNRTQKVILTGFIQGEELEELYSNAMLYVLPSEIEGMPLSLLEAMSYGNLCLTSDITENTDVTADHGMNFAVNDVNDLAEKLKYIVNNIDTLRKEERFCPETVREFILAKYHWDDVTKRTIARYESIIGK